MGTSSTLVVYVLNLLLLLLLLAQNLVHCLLNRLRTISLETILRSLSCDPRPLDSLKGLWLVVQRGGAPMRNLVRALALLDIGAVRGGELVTLTSGQVQACAIGAPSVRLSLTIHRGRH